MSSKQPLFPLVLEILLFAITTSLIFPVFSEPCQATLESDTSENFENSTRKSNRDLNKVLNQVISTLDSRISPQLAEKILREKNKPLVSIYSDEEVIWRLGAVIGLTIVDYVTGKISYEKATKVIQGMSIMADLFYAQIPPFPKQPEKFFDENSEIRDQHLFEVFRYLAESLSTHIGEKIGPPNSSKRAIFELSLVSSFTLLIYGPDDGPMNGDIAKELSKQAALAKIPIEFWEPVVKKIQQKNGITVVDQLMNTMINNVSIYLANLPPKPSLKEKPTDQLIFTPEQGTEEDFRKWQEIHSELGASVMNKDYENALVTAKAALDLNTKYFPNHPITAATLGDLAEIYEQLDRLSEAETFRRLELKALEKIHGPNAKALLFCLRSLGLLFLKQDQFKKAKIYFSRALDIQEKFVGVTHPLLIRELKNLASVYYNDKRYQQAEPLYKRAIAIHSVQEKPDLSHMFFIYNNLGMIYAGQERLTKASTFLEQAVTFGETIYPKNHSFIPRQRRLLADTLLLLKRYDEAYRHLDYIFNIEQETLEPLHPRIALDLVDLADIRIKQLKFPEAEKLLRKALAIQEKVLDPKDHYLGMTLAKLGAVLTKENSQNDVQAEELLRRALEIQEGTFELNNPSRIDSNNPVFMNTLIDTLYGLGTILVKQEKPIEVDNLFERIFESAANWPGGRSTFFINLSERISV